MSEITFHPRTVTLSRPSSQLRSVTPADISSQADKAAPIIAAVDGSNESARAADDAIRLADNLGAPVVFVHVRRGPSNIWGEPFYQQRLTRSMAVGRRILQRMQKLANRARVGSEQEILEGDPARRIVEFARSRGARLIVLGARRRSLRRSVSRQVVSASPVPVLVRGLSEERAEGHW